MTVRGLLGGCALVCNLNMARKVGLLETGRVIRRRPSLFKQPWQRAVWLLVVACAVAVLWAVAQVLAWPVAVRVALAGSAAAIGILVPEMRSRKEGDSRQGQLLNQVEVLVPGSALPRLRDVSSQQFRVHDSRVNVPYVTRDQESEVDAALSARRPVLIVGSSMAGKTRLAAARATAMFPDAFLWAPLPGNALRELLDEGLNINDFVIWLDDLDRYLTGDSWLDPGMLDRITGAGARVIGTIRRSALEVYRPRDTVRPAQWETVRRFTRIDLPRKLSEEEERRVDAKISNLALRAAIDRYGLAEYLGAGPDAVDRFDAGETNCPIGAALVRAAIDWRRASLARLVSLHDLKAALPIYLAGRHDILIDNTSVEESINWATDKINETVRLLLPYYPDPATLDVSITATKDSYSDEQLFEAFDYLVDLLVERNQSDDSNERDQAAIPMGMWSLVRRTAAPAEQKDVALAADAYFVSRPRVFTEVVAWLTSPSTGAPEILAITGSPGSGKSIIIQRLALMADPATRELVVDPLVPGLKVPPFDLVINARNCTRDELVSAISQAAYAPGRRNDPISDADVMNALLSRNSPFTLVVDAVDEADRPEEIAQLLTDLATGAPSRIRILIATRSYLVQYFTFARIIDLDAREYQNSSEVDSYIRHRLCAPGSPLADQPSAVDRIAERIASASNGNFLYAKLVCDAISIDGRLLDKVSLEGIMPSSISQYFEILPASLGPRERDAVAFLAALAHGPAEGLTSDDWVAAASELGHRSYSLADLDELILHTSLRTFVTADDSLNQRRYRLFHAAAREYFARRSL